MQSTFCLNSKSSCWGFFYSAKQKQNVQVAVVDVILQMTFNLSLCIVFFFFCLQMTFFPTLFCIVLVFWKIYITPLVYHLLLHGYVTRLYAQSSSTKNSGRKKNILLQQVIQKFFWACRIFPFHIYPPFYIAYLLPPFR